MVTPSARDGYLLIADISGYTAFIGGTELDHAQGIMAELVTLLVGSLTPPMTLAKVEGDAVFCYADATEFADGEQMLELAEVCYFEFIRTLEQMQRSTTCTCAACASISSLDLKFVGHFGAYVPQRIAGQEDITGADVILVHRLLKNSIVETSGFAAYIFLSDALLARFEGAPSLPAHTERYDQFGEVSGRVADLHAANTARRSAHRELVGAAEADIELETELPAPPRLVWEYFTDPIKVMSWESTLKSYQHRRNEHGRLAAGAESHCAHGSWLSVLQYADWRPYEYYTARMSVTKRSLSAAPENTHTIETLPLDGGRTLLRWRIRIHNHGLAMRAMMLVLRPMFKRELRADLAKLRRMLENDLAERKTVEGT